MHRFFSAVCGILFLLAPDAAHPVSVSAQYTTTAIASDPSPDKAYPASIETMQIPSGGSLLSALMYIAAGAGPHPVVVLLHGFPGNEKNLDLAQAIRRDGWNVLYFDYRGSWGSPGNFSFTHTIEDTQAAIAFLRDLSNAKKLRSDSAHIVLIGHSMGGFAASFAAAQDPGIEAVGLISAANLGGADSWPHTPGQADSIKTMSGLIADEGMAPLAGCSPAGLAQEVLANSAQWNFVHFAPKLASRPILVVTADDGLTATNEALVSALKNSGATRVRSIHMTTDHSYSDHRIALETAVLGWLDSLKTISPLAGSR